jgi:hypothetical protein
MPWHLAAPVSREVAVAGPAGRLIVLGGLTTGGGSASGVYAIRTATGAVRQVGALSAPMHDAAVAVIGGDAVVFGGGSPATVGTDQSFTLRDPLGRSGVATAAGSMPAPRSDAVAATIGPTIYVVGGYDGTRPDAVVLATTDGRTFTKVAALPVPVRYPAVAALGGKVFVFGGQAITVRTPARRWTLSRPWTRPGTAWPSSVICPSRWPVPPR